MYRREYPDIPGMFDARFREYNRPNLYREFQASWLISIVGSIMIIIGCGLLFWNEGRAVKTSVSLDEGLRDITVPETLNVVFEENSGKLVLVSGTLRIEDTLQDPAYAISINAVKLRRVVQMYQWYETEDQLSASLESAEHDSHREKTYSYSSDWFEYPIESKSFYNELGHHNPHPEDWPANSSIQTNSRVKIGNFLLGSSVKEKFTEFKPFTSGERPRVEGIKIYAGLYYHSANVWQPEIGDYRVQFTYAGRDGEEFTVVGRQSGREIRPYTTESGEELLILHPGIRTAAEVFRSEHNTNRTTTWIYRLAGWFISFLGFSCVANLLEMLIDLNPILRQILALGFSPIHFSASVTVTLAIIGFGWVWYRPLVGLSLVSISLVPYIVPCIRLLMIRRAERSRYRP
ncbi:transmembrane protein 43-like [Eurytemora carolleeae]|uniref:transmembrane protein 43-like n=1 Tax=Eurytemora carolleeae TaxID=1294199 RepID=UPI000C79182D|nr:transmembrane protein 43-like [Eurytemora carolleeae]|eukprot:XP_023320761.1 transmembrane protein 43-like [Eurytemora affinis]